MCKLSVWLDVDITVSLLGVLLISMLFRICCVCVCVCVLYLLFWSNSFNSSGHSWSGGKCTSVGLYHTLLSSLFFLRSLAPCENSTCTLERDFCSSIRSLTGTVLMKYRNSTARFSELKTSKTGIVLLYKLFKSGCT